MQSASLDQSYTIAETTDARTGRNSKLEGTDQTTEAGEIDLKRGNGLLRERN
jgi:hypothetical protein